MNFDDVEYNRWMRHAKNTLAGAEKDRLSEQYNWSCFKANQAVEYALKALLYGLGNSPFGHSLMKLAEKISELKKIDFEPIIKCIRLLERHYIPTRYPDSYNNGAPFEFYDDDTAKEAIECAKKIIKFLGSII
ncbi:MAG: HEPN domain-containing protein [Promethearchaeota archaeon]